MQKISKYGKFKFKYFSMTFKGLEFFPKIQGHPKTSQKPSEPCLRHFLFDSSATCSVTCVTSLHLLSTLTYILTYLCILNVELTGKICCKIK